jgi:histidinol-phosphatase (PHP family)
MRPAGGKVTANYHTHTTWCDGRDTPEEVILSAVAKGFSTIGFSSHAMLPESETDWVLTPEKAPRYAAEIRSLAARYAGRIRVLCGVEADYIPGGACPDRAVYASLAPDYIIASVHFVVSADGARVPVDHTPELLAAGIAGHFGGSAERFVRAYFRQEREMVERCDFDVIGHPDLVRKFNAKHPYFDETAAWYREELLLTAEAIAARGCLVELNTGAIARGWMADAYPSAAFRALLRERGVRFLLGSDAHTADAIDCAFDRFADAEAFVRALGEEKGCAG